MTLDLARGPDFQRMAKGTPGDEVVSSFSSPEIALFFVSIKTTSGKVQFSDLAFRIIRLDSGHAQNDGKSVNCGLPAFDGLPRSLDTWC